MSVLDKYPVEVTEPVYFSCDSDNVSCFDIVTVAESVGTTKTVTLGLDEPVTLNDAVRYSESLFVSKSEKVIESVIVSFRAVRDSVPVRERL